MPTYNVTLIDGGSSQELEKAKETFEEQGGIILHEYSLIKGFTIEFGDNNVQVDSTKDYYVEKDTPVSAT